MSGQQFSIIHPVATYLSYSQDFTVQILLSISTPGSGSYGRIRLTDIRLNYGCLCQCLTRSFLTDIGTIKHELVKFPPLLTVSRMVGAVTLYPRSSMQAAVFSILQRVNCVGATSKRSAVRYPGRNSAAVIRNQTRTVSRPKRNFTVPRCVVASGGPSGLKTSRSLSS